MQVKSIEEHVRASAEYKLGVANQSITAGFFDDNTRFVSEVTNLLSLRASVSIYSSFGSILYILP